MAGRSEGVDWGAEVEHRITAPDGEAACSTARPIAGQRKSIRRLARSRRPTPMAITALPDEPRWMRRRRTRIIRARRGDFFELRDPVTLVSSTDLDENGDRVPYLQAGKVPIDDPDDADAKTKRYFAFAVEDESVKADLSWSEAPPLPDPDDYLGGATDPQYLVDLEQAKAARLSARLSAAPGPDYADVQRESILRIPVPDQEMPFFDTRRPDETYRISRWRIR